MQQGPQHQLGGPSIIQQPGQLIEPQPAQANLVNLTFYQLSFPISPTDTACRTLQPFRLRLLQCNPLEAHHRRRIHSSSRRQL